MKEKWMVINKKEDFIKLTNEYEINPLIARLLANRGIVNKKEASLFLKGTVNDLNDASLMKDMKKAVSIIKGAIEEKKKIVIYGDYDCDGVCSTTILYRTLKKLGANFDYYIPNREDEGYGMNSDRIRKLKSEGAEVILTCDNGISAMEQVEVAKELGLTVIITDHHDIPYIEKEGNRINVVPSSDCVINPKQGNCEYPFKELCGAGVALKFSMELVNAMGRSFSEFYDLFQYAAIATICDVVELLGENRIIVKEGLKLINNTSSIGLKALIKATGLEGKEISEYHFGFVLGPCINATGRLETADLSVELLITEDEKYAEELAKKLYDLNVERQELTFDSVESVISKVEEEITNGEKVILVYDEGIHESIAGIVAGRVRERFNLPAIVMTKGKDMPKGSARSIEGYNMFEELLKCKDLLIKFGGHPMAAGLSISEDSIDLLRERLNRFSPLTKEDLVPKVYLDMQLPIRSISYEIIDELHGIEPFGKANPKPLFGEKGLKVIRASILGKNRNVLKLQFLSKEGLSIEGIYFGDITDFEYTIMKKYGESELRKLYNGNKNDIILDIVFYPEINEFNGNTSIQLIIEDLR